MNREESQTRGSNATVEDKISELIDRPCHGPDCAVLLREDGPSSDFCSDSCQRQWRAARSGVELDAWDDPVIPDGLAGADRAYGLFQFRSGEVVPWASRDYRPMPMQVMNLQAFAIEFPAVRATLDASSAVSAFRVESASQDAVMWGFDPKTARPHQLTMDAMVEARRARWDRTNPSGFAYIQDEVWPLLEAAPKVSWWRREWRAVARYFRGE